MDGGPIPPTRSRSINLIEAISYNYNYTMRLTKNAKNVLTITVLAAALYGVSFLLVEKTFVPQNFTDARMSTAKSADELMVILGASQENLARISEFHQSNDYKNALDLVSKELVNRKESYAKAQQLTTELNNMSNTANGITPVKARNLALEAVKLEISLMSGLITYNESFNSLLENLRLKFEKIVTDNSLEIQRQIELMNSAGKEINNLNEQFTQKMSEFDKLTAK